MTDHCKRLLAVALLAATFAGAQELRLATTHTLEDSGLLRRLIPQFESASGLTVRMIIAGTGQVLNIAAKGDADVVLSHSRADEEKFVAAGFGLARRDVMYNDFVVVGPQADPAGIRGITDAVSAFRKIAAARPKFVSRGDDSGTHKKERALWQAAGLVPQWNGYVSAGLGMGQVLLMAGEFRAYTLADRATYAALRAKSGLEILLQGDPRLLNEYAVIVVNPARRPHVNHKAASAFADWITSDAGRKLIAGFKVDREQVFFPAAKAAR